MYFNSLSSISPSPGTPHVASLKTRLLALQVLGTIMNELSTTSPQATEKCAKVGPPFMWECKQSCSDGFETVQTAMKWSGNFFVLREIRTLCKYACPDGFQISLDG